MAAGLAAGIVGACFLHYGFFFSFMVNRFTGAYVYTLTGSIVFILAGGLIGRLKSRDNELRKRLNELLQERTERLRVSEERFAHAVRTVNDGVWERDLVSGEVYLSRRFCEMVGYTKDELGGDPDDLMRIIAQEDHAHCLPVFNACASGEQDGFELQFRLHHKSGGLITVLSRGVVIRRDGVPVRLMGTTIDITERLRVLEALERTEEMLYEGIQALPVGFAFFDASDRLVLYNDSYQRLLEGRGGDLVRNGVDFAALIRAGACGVPAELGYSDADAYVAARIAATRSNRAPWLYGTEGGTWIRMTEFPTYSGGFISLVEDVTEERNSEMRLRQSQRLEVIGQLTGGIAHDFNNVLAVIQGCAELLRMSEPADRSLVEQTLNAVRRGSDLTRRLLAYARRQPLAPSSIDCGAMIEDMTEVLSRSLGEHVSLTVSVQPEVWRAHADLSQVEDTLMNLALNARDAMPEGGQLTLSCTNETLGQPGDSRHPDAPPGDYVRLRVSDTGMGMSAEVLDKAIEPFFTTKPFGKGSGLGLSMVYGFVRQSGGHVSIRSEPGAGTTVDVYLPRDKTPRIEPLSKPKAEVPSGNGETVLLIEDDELVRKLVTRMLVDLKFVPTAAEDAEEAQRLLGDGRRFDLVLTDVVLPGGVSGPQFARTIGPHLPPGRVVFMSGYPDGTAEGDEVSGQGHALLQKPFRRGDLARVLQRALAGASGTEAKAPPPAQVSN